MATVSGNIITVEIDIPALNAAYALAIKQAVKAGLALAIADMKRERRANG